MVQKGTPSHMGPAMIFSPSKEACVTKVYRALMGQKWSLSSPCGPDVIATRI